MLGRQVHVAGCGGVPSAPRDVAVDAHRRDQVLNAGFLPLALLGALQIAGIDPLRCQIRALVAQLVSHRFMNGVLSRVNFISSVARLRQGCWPLCSPSTPSSAPIALSPSPCRMPISVSICAKVGPASEPTAEKPWRSN